MLRNPKFIAIVILFGVIMTAYPSMGDISIPLNSRFIPHQPVARLQKPEGFKVTHNKAVYRLGDISMISGNIVSGHILLTTFEGFGVPWRKTSYALQLFKPVEIRMPTVEGLYETYGYYTTVKQRLDFYKRSRNDFAERLRRAGRYIDEIAKIIVEMGMPPEISYLPLIESGFNVHAYSPKRAAGLWQFIPATAKRYGLKIDWWVDERLDPVKSTFAAAKYLKDLYEIFGDWSLALAAYNAGESRIDRAVKKIQEKDFWSIRKTGYISRETRNYIPSFIAATAIALEPERFGFYGIETHEPMKYDLVEIDTPMDLSVVARFTDTTISEIKELNPELRRWSTPPNVSTYTLRVPAGTKKLFLTNLSNVGEEELFYVKLHKVKPGDTVSKIARQLGTSIQAIIDLNSLGKDALIVAGQILLVPVDRMIEEFKEGTDILKPILKGRNP